MFSIGRFAVENLETGCVTDEKKPSFTWYVDSDAEGTAVESARISVNGWTWQGKDPIVSYEGPSLRPFTAYTAELTVQGNHGESAEKKITFRTGRMETPWTGKWISDASYTFTEKKVSPVPMVFRKTFSPKGKIRSAFLYATALGIYEADLNGTKLGDRYFAPGFTSYKTNLEYQTYDLTPALREGTNELLITVAGGWAVGSFVFTRVNRQAADRQAILCELRITYEDGREEVIGSDESFEVTENGPVRMADLYDGETYDAQVDLSKADFHKASPETLRVHPRIMEDLGSPVRVRQILKPVSKTKVGDEWIYDFGQNFAGVVHFKVDGKAGQHIVVRHAEILNADGTLNTKFLRTAKAAIDYTCRDGVQEYAPRFTYMGFRYISVRGADDIKITAYVLSSDLRRTGSFICSNEDLNRLEQNIEWSSCSNLMDIPTDCPQRDERMGWTGDINVFSPVACYLFDMSRFFKKWLLDVKAEQLRTGGISNTVPVNGYGFPATMPEMAIDFWGDACVSVPWNEYEARGDVRILKDMYPVMKKYVDACRRWAGIGVGLHRYIWNTPSVLHFGDWVAPDVPKMQQWQARSKWTATASLCHTSDLLARTARILGYEKDAETYETVSKKTGEAYQKILTDGNGTLENEFQTGYVLPIHYHMFDEAAHRKAVENLDRMIRANDYRIGTGFPGTPYILFALADNGKADTAYRMLLNTKCPSWLYEVKMGATTIWERWDGLSEDGSCRISDDGTDMMISYNHYASGAVGDFFYRRIAGIEKTEPGYHSFTVKPLIGGGLTFAKGQVETPYGVIESAWRIQDREFSLTVKVPVGTACTVVLPDGTRKQAKSGTHVFTAALQK